MLSQRPVSPNCNSHLPSKYMHNNSDNTKNLSWSKQPKKNRWFFYMNTVIAIVVLSAAFLLKDSTSLYQPRSAYDVAYVEVSSKEKDPKMLHNGIVYTEAARAHAYRSIIRQSNGTFVIGLIVSLAFIANSIYIFKLANRQKVVATV
jgi:hypothetical protein